MIYWRFAFGTCLARDYVVLVTYYTWR